MKKKKSPRKQTTLGQIWHFIWYDDSILSWIVNVILAFLIVKFIFYPGLSLIVGTPLPLVAVTSSSMEHRPSTENSISRMCGKIYDEQGRVNLDDWWSVCGTWYEDNTNITLNDFEDFPLRNGFNKGDIIFLRGPKNLAVGDVIVFESGKQYPIIHRIIELNETNIKTKGDNNPSLIRDSQLDEDRINPNVVIGKAYAKIPYLGYIKIWFTQFIQLFIN